jgi:two-component system, chemotaxis family, protein-glutamate methylesterase/glutaminase
VTKRLINVLVVEDSRSVQLLLKHVIEADPQLRVMGMVDSGEAALAFLARERPDVVLMDVYMPNLNGFDTTRRIMETQPLPIVICSATMRREEVDTTFRALDAGAVAFVEKPAGPGHERFDPMVRELVETVKLMSEVRVVKRWARHRRRGGSPAAVPATRKSATTVEVVAIGASTGGPSVIRTILAGLPSDFPVPVLVVQHIAAGFLEGMVDWLAPWIGLPVQMAVHGRKALPGHVYLAPNGFQMGLGAASRILLSKEGTPGNGLQPSVSHLFRSVVDRCGANAVGVLLTGMGRDGAEELKLMRDKGAVTIAQDKESSVVHGMPGEAIALKAATHVLPPDGIAARLVALVKK